MRNTRMIVSICCLVGFASAMKTTNAESPSAEKFLLDGKLAEGEMALTAALQAKPEDQQTRFGLGAVQFVAAVEHLGQNFYKFGLRDHSRQFGSFIPFLRLPVPENLAPQKLTYEAARQIMQTFADDLAKAEATLAPINDPQIKLPLHVTQIKLDFVGQGLGSTTLADVLQRLRAIPGPRDLLVHFDRADVSWLRGYCHLLSAMSEVVLAYDGREIFDSTAHVFFQRVESPLMFLQAGRKVFAFGGNDHIDFADVIAFIHLIRMPVKEPQRMLAALEHLEKMLALSREMWQQIQAETDDDHEWIPNAKQHGELNLRVTQEMIDGWLFGVQEAELVLQGKRLIPFWRGNGERGINLRRVFTEPRPFDLVLWVQGTAAAPYLEQGEITSPAVWDRLQRVFRGEFVVFALWFN